MRIECPACQARATVPDEKAGARVRCGRCKEVFVAEAVAEAATPKPGAPQPARPRVTRSREAPAAKASAGPWMMWLGIAGAVMVLFLIFMRGREDENTGESGVQAGGSAQESSSTKSPPRVVRDDWESEEVQTAVRLHEAAFEGDLETLTEHLDGERLWLASERAAGREPEDDAWRDLRSEERRDALEILAQALVDGDDAQLVAQRRAFEGAVIERYVDRVVVRLETVARDASQGVATWRVDWTLAPEERPGGLRWRAYEWARYLTAEEVAKANRPKPAYDRVILPEGALVYEREPEAIPPLEGTPDEFVERVEALVATMTDMSLTVEQGAARGQIVPLGYRAVPPLLTALAEVYASGVTTDDEAIQANQIILCLRDITGESFNYNPQVVSGLTNTPERRLSSIRRWFAWWVRKGPAFLEAAREAEAQGGAPPPGGAPNGDPTGSSDD